MDLEISLGQAKTTGYMSQWCIKAKVEEKLHEDHTEINREIIVLVIHCERVTREVTSDE